MRNLYYVADEIYFYRRNVGQSPADLSQPSTVMPAPTSQVVANPAAVAGIAMPQQIPSGQQPAYTVQVAPSPQGQTAGPPAAGQRNLPVAIQQPQNPALRAQLYQAMMDEASSKNNGVRMDDLGDVILSQSRQSYCYRGSNVTSDFQRHFQNN